MDLGKCSGSVRYFIKAVRAGLIENLGNDIGTFKTVVEASAAANFAGLKNTAGPGEDGRQKEQSGVPWCISFAPSVVHRRKDRILGLYHSLPAIGNVTSFGSHKRLVKFLSARVPTPQIRHR